MDELGSILREARETKGLTLTEVQEKIRINARYLEAMESGSYHLLPTPVHVRGFLRNYARFLGLNPEPLLDRYTAGQNNQPLPVPLPREEAISPSAPLPSRADQPFFEPVNVNLEADTGRSPESTLRVVIIIAFVLAIGLAVSRFLPLALGQGDGQDNITDTIQSILESDSDPTPTTEAALNITAEPIVPTGRNSTGLPTLPPATPTRPALPATMETIQLRLDITERTWLQVTIDGQIAFEGQAKQGDGPFQWEAQQSARLLTGNAAGVVVTINGIELGRLAGRGEVADETWNTTSN